MGEIHISSQIVTGYPWCRHAPWGRYATVQLGPESFRWGYLCPSTYAPKPGSGIVVYRGPEVVVDCVDGQGVPYIDERGYPIPRPSDTGSGGFTIHRHFPDGRTRVRTPEQAEADRVREAERKALARRRAG